MVEAPPQPSVMVRVLPWLVVLALCAGAGALWWPHLSRPMWFDEQFSAYVALQFRPVGELLRELRLEDTHPPLHYLILQGWLALVGYKAQVIEPGSEWLFRMPSFIAGLACIPAAYWAVQGLASRWAALAVAAVLAFSPAMFSQVIDARMYAQLSLLLLLIWGFAFRGKWLGAGLFTLLALYLHVYGILIALAVFVYAVWKGGPVGAMSIFFPSALYMLWLPSFAMQASRIDSLTSQGLSSRDMLRMLFAVTTANATWAILVVIALFFIFLQFMKKEQRTPLLFMLSLPVMALIIGSFTVFNQVRYAGLLSIPLVIVLCVGMFDLASRGQWGRGLAALAVPLLALGGPWSPWGTKPFIYTDQYGAAMQAVKKLRRGGEPIYFALYDVKVPIHAYLGPAPQVELKVADLKVMKRPPTEGFLVLRWLKADGPAEIIIIGMEEQERKSVIAKIAELQKSGHLKVIFSHINPNYYGEQMVQVLRFQQVP